jgi:ABC-type Fe3+ transport system substrate-binding protein
MVGIRRIGFGFILIVIGSSGTVHGGQAGSSEAKNMKELVAKAKSSNHVVTLSLEATDAQVIRAKEQAFEKRFGFPVRMETQPGHHRDMPVKIMEAAKSGRGVLDMWDGGTPLLLGMFRAGNTRQPPWDVIFEGWPLARKLRAGVPEIGGGPGGTKLSDHCMYMGNTSWSIVYNTRKVKSSEVKGIKLDDLTTDKWRNRVVWDANALGLYTLPFAPGWDVERMRIYSHNLGANGTKLVGGGSVQVLQSIVQGEGDIGLASMSWVAQQKKLGAPLEIGFADFIMGNVTVACLTNPPVNDRDMATLFWAWDVFDGNYVEAGINGGAVLRLYPEEEKYFPLAKLARQHGITSEDQVVGPKTEEDAEKSGKYRKIAIQALKDGVASKKKLGR